jgi:hypothetical protein
VVTAVKFLVAVPVFIYGVLSLGGFAQSRNEPISFVMSVCPSVCLSVCLCFRLSAGIFAAISGWIFVKFYIGRFNKNLLRNFKFGYSWTKIWAFYIKT